MSIFDNYSNQQSSEASSAARVKLEEHIGKKISSARAVLDQVESQIIDDRVEKGKRLEFQPSANFVSPDFPTNNKMAVIASDGKILSLHDHALMQVSGRAGVPAIYTRNLLAGSGEQDDWKQELLAHNFNQHYRHGNGTKYLVRSVGNEARGFLSDRFKRMDSRPLLESFVGAASSLGAVPVEGFALDTKVRMRAILPVVFEPIPNEVFAFGVEWGTSDFGDGGNYLSIFLLRLWCLNGATMTDVMRKIHLGSRLSEDIEFSRETYELDTRANAAALKDSVKFALAPARLDAFMDVLKTANDDQLTDKQAENTLKKVLSKDEAQKAFDVYKSPDVINLPKGNTTYRLSNAVSWIANFEDLAASRQLDLQKIAGDILPAPAKAAMDMAAAA